MQRNAFTLIELLVAIAIVGILASLLLPVMSMVRTMANTTKCANIQRQLAVAGMAYAQDNARMLAPTRGLGAAPLTDRDGNGKGWEWQFFLAEYLEEQQTVGNPVLTTQRVVGGCPQWPRSEAWPQFGATSWWNTGYGQTGLLLPGYGNRTSMVDEWCQTATGRMGTIVASMTMVTRASERPWFGDCADYWLWPQLYIEQANNSGALRIKGMQHHREKTVVAYFDGHVDQCTYLELIEAQNLGP